MIGDLGGNAFAVGQPGPDEPVGAGPLGLGTALSGRPAASCKATRRQHRRTGNRRQLISWRQHISTAWHTRAGLACAVVLTAGLTLTAAAGCQSAPPPVRPSAHPVAAMPGRSTPRPAPATGAASPANCPAAPYGVHLYAPGTAKTVALTFDDGPGRSTEAILTILARYRVPATFFNIGAAMATRPWLVREEVREGYAMGNHTWNHPHMIALSAVQQGCGRSTPLTGWQMARALLTGGSASSGWLSRAARCPTRSY